MAAPNEIAPGPTMLYAIAAVKRLRRDRRFSQADLSAELANVGHPIRATGIHRLETGKRRIDVDDLVALAAAFKVPIGDLLPPQAGPVEEPSLGDVAERLERIEGWIAERDTRFRLALRSA